MLNLVALFLKNLPQLIALMKVIQERYESERLRVKRSRLDAKVKRDIEIIRRAFKDKDAKTIERLLNNELD